MPGETGPLEQQSASDKGAVQAPHNADSKSDSEALNRPGADDQKDHRHKQGGDVGIE